MTTINNTVMVPSSGTVPTTDNDVNRPVHLAPEPENPLPLYWCDSCKIAFNSMEQMGGHMASRKHMQKVEDIINGKPDKAVISSPGRLLHCNTCNISYSSQQMYDFHVNSPQHKERCANYNSVRNNALLKQQVEQTAVHEVTPIGSQFDNAQMQFVNDSGISVDSYSPYCSPDDNNVLDPNSVAYSQPFQSYPFPVNQNGVGHPHDSNYMQSQASNGVSVNSNYKPYSSPDYNDAFSNHATVQPETYYNSIQPYQSPLQPGMYNSVDNSYISYTPDSNFTSISNSNPQQAFKPPDNYHSQIRQNGNHMSSNVFQADSSTVIEDGIHDSSSNTNSPYHPQYIGGTEFIPTNTLNQSHTLWSIPNNNINVPQNHGSVTCKNVPHKTPHSEGHYNHHYPSAAYQPPVIHGYPCRTHPDSFMQHTHCYQHTPGISQSVNNNGVCQSPCCTRGSEFTPISTIPQHPCVMARKHNVPQGSSNVRSPLRGIVHSHPPPVNCIPSCPCGNTPTANLIQYCVTPRCDQNIIIPSTTYIIPAAPSVCTNNNATRQAQFTNNGMYLMEIPVLTTSNTSSVPVPNNNNRTEKRSKTKRSVNKPMTCSELERTTFINLMKNGPGNENRVRNGSVGPAPRDTRGSLQTETNVELLSAIMNKMNTTEESNREVGTSATVTKSATTKEPLHDNKTGKSDTNVEAKKAIPNDANSKAANEGSNKKSADSNDKTGKMAPFTIKSNIGVTKVITYDENNVKSRTWIDDKGNETRSGENNTTFEYNLHRKERDGKNFVKLKTWQNQNEGNKVYSRDYDEQQQCGNKEEESCLPQHTSEDGSAEVNGERSHGQEDAGDSQNIWYPGPWRYGGNSEQSNSNPNGEYYARMYQKVWRRGSNSQYSVSSDGSSGQSEKRDGPRRKNSDVSAAGSLEENNSGKREEAEKKGKISQDGSNKNVNSSKDGAGLTNARCWRNDGNRYGPDRHHLSNSAQRNKDSNYNAETDQKPPTSRTFFNSKSRQK